MEDIFSDVPGMFGAEMDEEDDGYVYYGGLKLGVVPKVSGPARTGNIAAHVCVCVQEGLEDDPGTEGIGSSELGYKRHGQRAVLAGDYVGGGHRDRSDRGREPDELRAFIGITHGFVADRPIT